MKSSIFHYFFFLAIKGKKNKQKMALSHRIGGNSELSRESNNMDR